MVSEKNGRDKVVLSKDSTAVLNVHGNIEYKRKGSDIILNLENNKGQITLKNYLKNGVDNVFFDDSHSISLKELLNLESSATCVGSANSKKKQKLTGTFLSETFTGGKKNDKITTGAGDDIIRTSKGSDTVTINGSGLKTILNDSGDPKNIGNMTVKFAKNLEYGEGKTQLDISYMQGAISDSTFYYEPDDIDHENPLYYSYFYQKSGNDLVLNSNYEQMLDYVFGRSKSFKPTTKLTIKDFFKNEGVQNSTIVELDSEYNKLNFAQSGNYLSQIGNIKKSNKMTDTKYMDSLYGGNKKDTFTIVNGNTDVIGGKGNDVINVKESATGTLNVINRLGSGNDILNIDAQSYVHATVQLSNTALLATGEAKIKFDVKDYDLIYQIIYNKGGSELNLAKTITDSITIKNFFINNNWMNNMQFVYGCEYDSNTNTYTDKVASYGSILAELGQVMTYYDKDKKTWNMIGSDVNDTYTYNGEGKVSMSEHIASHSNDTYNLTITNKSNLEICDYYGQDTIKFNFDIDDLRVFIDYNEPYSGTGNGTFYPDIFFYDKDTFTTPSDIVKWQQGDYIGGCRVIGYFSKTGSNSFKFQDKNGADITSNITDWINSVKSKVQSWVDNPDHIPASATVALGNDTYSQDIIEKCYISYNEYLNS